MRYLFIYITCQYELFEVSIIYLYESYTTSLAEKHGNNTRDAFWSEAACISKQKVSSASVAKYHLSRGGLRKVGKTIQGVMQGKWQKQTVGKLITKPWHCSCKRRHKCHPACRCIPSSIALVAHGPPSDSCGRSDKRDNWCCLTEKMGRRGSSRGKRRGSARF